MISLNLLACTTGKSAGLASWRMRPGIGAELAPHVRKVGSVAHQPADFDILTPHVGRGDCVAPTRRLVK